MKKYIFLFSLLFNISNYNMQPSSEPQTPLTPSTPDEIKILTRYSNQDGTKTGDLRPLTLSKLPLFNVVIYVAGQNKGKSLGRFDNQETAQQALFNWLETKE